MTIFFDDDDFEPLGPGRDDAKPGSPAGRNDTGGADLDRIDNDDYLLEAGFAAEAHLGRLVDGDDDGDGNPWTPAGLEDRFYEDMREHLDGAPDPGTREALRGNLDRIWERTRPEVVGREHARRLRKRATVGEGMLARYRELAAANPALAPMVLQEADDTLGRLQGLGTARDAIDERRRMFRTEVRDAVLNRASETDPRGALEAFKSGGYAELFDGDDEDGRKAWEGHLTQAAVTRDDDDAWERERDELENRQMKGLAAVMFRAEREQAIRSGDVSGAKITQAVKSGLIGREEGEQLRQAVLARREELKEEAGRYAEISDTIMRGKALPTRTREWIDPWYREVMKPALELMDPRAREVVDLDIIRRAGRVPEDRIKEIRRGLNGDDPQAVIDSAGWIGRLRDEMPEVLPGLREWLPHGEYDRAIAIADAIDAGYPAGKIMEELPRPAIRDKLWRRDPSEGDGVELKLFDSGGGGEAGDGPGGEAEGAGEADGEFETAILKSLSKWLRENRGKRKGPDDKDGGPPPAPPVPLPGGGTGEQVPPDPERPRVPDSFDQELRDFADGPSWGEGGNEVLPTAANAESKARFMERQIPGTPEGLYQPSWDENRKVFERKFGKVKNDEFVHVHASKNSKVGEFIMRRSDFEYILKTEGPEGIKDRFSLPEVPKWVTPVVPEADIDGRIGVAAENEFGRGGGIQVELPRGLNPEWFGEPQPIGTERVR